jgi:hypothetical protein
VIINPLSLPFSNIKSIYCFHVSYTDPLS